MHPYPAGRGNRLLEAERELAISAGSVVRRERLGGLLNYYHRQAA